MTHHDIVEIITSSLVGFIVGYVSCLVGQKASRQKLLSMQWVDGRRLLGVMVVLLSVATVVVFWREDSARANLAACIGAENDRTQQAIAARGAANQATGQAQKDVIQAQRVFLTALNSPNITDEERHAAYVQYLGALDKVDAALDHLDETQRSFPLVKDGCT